MNFADYEKKDEALYAEFAEIVKFILENAIAATTGIPRPQSIQFRAKSAVSLRPKLEARGLLDSNSIENDIKDLAGVRLIFYTNTDVERFLNSGLIPENFEIDRDSTRIHHPTKENKGVRYQGIHYTIEITEQRKKLSEYAKFNGMRCEVQIQTILNHAWSETSHDIIYKEKPTGGFGTKAMELIANRFNQIMDKYLLPAGYEFQSVQYDYERLQQGKELFNRDVIKALETAKNNNERRELLWSFKEYVLPYYDDIPGIYSDLSKPLIAVAKASRTAPLEPIKTIFGDVEGKSAADVTNTIVDIFDSLRYVDIECTFSALCEIYRDESDSVVQKRICDAVKNLAHYDLDVWQRAGPYVQLALVDIIERIETNQRRALRPIITTVCGEVLQSGLSGTSWKADTVTFSSGALPLCDDVETIREKAISSLFDLFSQSNSETQKREVISALRNAIQLPSQVEFSNELLALTLIDAKKIVEFLADQATIQPYELVQHLEHKFLYDYRRFREIAEDEKNRFGCRSVAANVLQSIETFRDKVNDDEQFIRYKTLVGFQTVLPPHWNDESFDFTRAHKYRLERVTEYIEAISDSTEEEWYQVIARCAATKSSDGATFLVFGEFLSRLAKAKPEIAGRFLELADDNVLNFLPMFLDGLSDSGLEREYQAVLTRFLDAGKHLGAIAYHFRRASKLSNDSIVEVLEKAIRAKDDIAVNVCLILAMERHRPQEQFFVRDVFVPAIQYLNSKQDVRWVREAWALPACATFFASLSSDQANLVLDSLAALPQMEHEAETILVYIAQQDPEAVWKFFERRLSRKLENEEERYEAFPHHFGELKQPLAQNAELAIRTVRSWFRPGDPLFSFDGGRLLSYIFPTFPEEFANELSNMAMNGSDEDTKFILGILQNYKGEPATHAVLKALINRLPEGDTRLTEVEISLQNTNVVTGEFGFVDAYRRKKVEMISWLDDSRPRVKAFAEGYIRRLDQRIASEQRSAEQQREFRKRIFNSADEN
jgi:ppGpp synthetase/RelA/SpoT-type nucleotidyltranferase